jgi:hypothetical protein
MNLRNVIVLIAALLLGILATVTQAADRPCVHCGLVHGVVAVQSPPIAVASQPRFANDGLDVLNRQRAARGIGPLVADSNLMHGALNKATRAAGRNYRGHLGGSLYGASKEGVGWTSGGKSFNSCYAWSAPEGTPAGAALVRGTGGWYSCLLIHHQGYLPSGSTASRLIPRGRFFRR